MSVAYLRHYSKCSPSYIYRLRNRGLAWTPLFLSFVVSQLATNRSRIYCIVCVSVCLSVCLSV